MSGTDNTGKMGVIAAYNSFYDTIKDHEPKVISWNRWAGEEYKSKLLRKFRRGVMPNVNGLPEEALPLFHSNICDVLANDLGWIPVDPINPEQVNTAKEMNSYRKPTLWFHYKVKSEGAIGEGVYVLTVGGYRGRSNKGKPRSAWVTIDASNKTSLEKLCDPAKQALEKLVLGFALLYRNDIKVHSPSHFLGFGD